MSAPLIRAALVWNDHVEEVRIRAVPTTNNTPQTSDGRYRYFRYSFQVQLSISINTSHSYFSGRYVCILENVKKLACNFKKIFFQSGEIFK